MLFAGHSFHVIDAKNRLAIPARFRNELDPQSDVGLYVVPGLELATLWLYPRRLFQQLADQGGSSLIPDEDQHNFERVFFTLAEFQEFDNQGRIIIPDEMLRRAGLGKEVVVCGVRDHLEIRRRDEFKRQLDDYWERFREYQLRAREVYRQRKRQAGPHAGDT